MGLNPPEFFLNDKIPLTEPLFSSGILVIAHLIQRDLTSPSQMSVISCDTTMLNPGLTEMGLI